MNPNYTEFKFPQIKAHPWVKVFRSRTPPDIIDLVAKVLVYSPDQRMKPMEALLHPSFDELRDPGCKLPNGNPLPGLFDFTQEECSQATPEIMEQLIPSWHKKK